MICFTNSSRKKDRYRSHFVFKEEICREQFFFTGINFETSLKLRKYKCVGRSNLVV